ncbi:hypothetical protein COCON_G00033380 [Conger conger]|uniref:Transmembrane protein 106A n=1 Tax=Conger conger TaxID=82655 RepID=A0A9Q1I7H7_CONCO|nr:transmembrane protein 106B-like [Conger conger]KAJ8284488.1 hypothetical protein COCON_G00033380 [Conger conger]
MPMGVSMGHRQKPTEEEHIVPKDPEKRKLPRKDYGSTSNDGCSNCPTCRGTGRIPRGQEAQLVAVIPCSDQRLKPRRTKLYVCMSVVLCLFICTLILFFLFPRSVSLSPVELKSSYVFFTPNTVQMNLTNVLNITNENFLAVQACNLDLQILIADTIVGKIKIANVTTITPRSQKVYTYGIPITIADPGLNNYCKSTSFRIHTLFLHLQMTMKVFYLAHSEQLSMDTFQYVDCGNNSTIPHDA